MMSKYVDLVSVVELVSSFHNGWPKWIADLEHT